MHFKRFAAAVSAVAAVVLGFIFLSGCSQEGPRGTEMGGDLLSRVQAKGELTVALEGTWSPWGYHDEGGALVGYDVEVAQAIADKLGVKAAFVEGEFTGLLAGLEAGRYDVMVNGVEIDESRKEKYDFSAPYAYSRIAVIVRSDDDSIQSMEDLEGKSTANTLNSTYAAVGERYGAQVTGVDDFIQTIQLLTDGRIDATLNAEESFYDYLREHPDAPVKIACMDPDPTQVAIPMPKGADSDSLRAAIDQALAELREDGTLSKLALKYFSTDISRES